MLFVSVQSSRHSKLEKADILEMTVKHLRSLQRLQMAGRCCSRAPLPLATSLPPRLRSLFPEYLLVFLI